MKYTEISIKPELVGVKGVASLLNISETSVRKTRSLWENPSSD